MDVVTHTLLGAALCSRTGLAGGRRGPTPSADGRPRIADWTLPAAFFFGAFPDLMSMGLHMIPHYLLSGEMGWSVIPSWVFTLYDLSHSLVVVVPLVALAAWLHRPLAVCMLAWPIHIVTDMLTHGPGRFATPILFPLSDYRFSGIDWWKTPWLFQFPLLLLAVAWLFILRYRRRQSVAR